MIFYNAYEKPELEDIEHYGVKGMKWGVRRYRQSKKDVDSIVKTLSKKDREMLGIYEGSYGISKGEHFLNRTLIKNKNIPISVFDITKGNNYINVSVITRKGNAYRGKGYGKQAVKSGIDWWDKNKSRYKNQKLNWWVRRENEASIRLAKSAGFVLNESDLEKWKDWYHYERR